MDRIGETTLRIMREVGWYNDWLFSFLEPNIKGRILEVGSGIGNFTPLLAKKGRVVAIDVNEDYVKKLRKLSSNKISAGFGDIEAGKYFFKNNLPAGPPAGRTGRQGKFDTIVCLNVLEHIQDDKRALTNMHKLLAKNGILLLLVPSHQFAYGSLDEKLGHHRRYDKRSLAKLLKKSGLSVTKMRYLNLLGLIGWFVNSKILKREILPKNQLMVFNKLARLELVLEKATEPPIGLSILAVAKKP
ncbi:class I SAM-dependent methyltransferase [Patescibacteria group bacterium]|nr:class I SAM-dependent methyltransferase [Patescibacteria group bacterium]